MAHYRRNSVLVRQAVMLVTLPLLLAGLGYALFSQNLSLVTDTRNVSYTSTQYMAAKYTKTVTPQGPAFLYSFAPMTIYNKGVTDVSAWQIKFDVPSDTTSLSCPSTVTCSRTGNTVTIVNGAGNGTIVPNGSTGFNFSFVSAVQAISLENIIVSGTFSATYQTVAGLGVTVVAGKKTGGKYPLTITITNNSGQSMSGWQVRIPTTATCTSTVPANVTYTCTTTFLTYTGSIAIATGNSYQFTTSVTYGVNGWTARGATVLGRG